MATEKKDPFIEALRDDTGARPPTRAAAQARLASSTRPATRPAARHARNEGHERPERLEVPRPSMNLSLDPRLLPLPLRAAFFFAVLMTLAMLAAPLVGRLVVGGRGLDNAMVTFARESGVSVMAMASTVPLLAAGLALLVYLNARRKVTHMRHAMSRGLLVGLLTWVLFAAWATRLWCLPQYFIPCYSKILTVSGLLGGGPILIAGLLGGFIVGRSVLKAKPKTILE